jgi:hypothetical protein
LLARFDKSLTRVLRIQATRSFDVGVDIGAERLKKASGGVSCAYVHLPVAARGGLNCGLLNEPPVSLIGAYVQR